MRDYTRCVEAGACKEPWRGDPWSTYPVKLDYPVNMVSWTKAHAYCAWAGERLPDRGGVGVGGHRPRPDALPVGRRARAVLRVRRLHEVRRAEVAGRRRRRLRRAAARRRWAAHPKGDKIWPGGALHDLAGNVWEWVEDSFAPYSERDADRSASSARTTPSTRLRGGGWNRSYAAMVVTYRGAAHYGYQVPALGFRCVRGEPLATPSPAHE